VTIARNRAHDPLHRFAQIGIPGHHGRRIEIALHRTDRSENIRHVVHRKRPGTPHALHAALSGEPLLRRTESAGEADHRNIDAAPAQSFDDAPERLDDVSFAQPVSQITGPGIKDLNGIRSGLHLAGQIFDRGIDHDVHEM